MSLYLIPGFVRLIIMMLTFIAMALQVANIMMIHFRISEKNKKQRMILGMLVLIYLMGSVYILAEITLSSAEGVFKNPIPFFKEEKIFFNKGNILYILGNTLVITLVVADFFSNLDAMLHSITRISIKEALDSLPVGGISFNDQGRAVFVNRAMEEAARDMGLDLGKGGEVLRQEIRCRSVVHEDYFDKNAKIQRDSMGEEINKENYLVRTQGKAWEMTYSKIMIKGKPLIHISALEVTKEDKLNQVLTNQSEELKEMNEEIRQIEQTLEETQREQTVLELKNRIHDIMGQRLSVIHQILEENKHVNLSMREFKELLHNMLKDLRDKGMENPEKVFQNIVSTCKLIRVDLSKEGAFVGTSDQQRVMLKVIREAVTNAIRHGKAKHIRVRIYETKAHLVTEVKNDGILPHEHLVEGDGISGMRRRAEEENGALAITKRPEFKVELVLPK